MRGPRNFIVPPHFNFYFNPWKEVYVECNQQTHKELMELSLSTSLHMHDSSKRLQLMQTNLLLARGTDLLACGRRIPHGETVRDHNNGNLCRCHSIRLARVACHKTQS